MFFGEFDENLFGGGVDTGRLGDVLCAATLPIDVGSRHLSKDLDLVAIHGNRQSHKPCFLEASPSRVSTAVPAVRHPSA